MVLHYWATNMLITMAPTAPDQVCIFLAPKTISSPFSHYAFLTVAQLWTAIGVIHYAFPAVVSLYFLIALAATVCTLQTRRLRVQDQPVRRDVMLGLIFGIALTYVRPVPYPQGSPD